MNMARLLLGCGGVMGFLGVALGAFGAHGLRDRLSESMMAAYQTGVLYHLVHAVALFSLGLCAQQWQSTALYGAGWCFVAGILIFSGSLYIYAVTGVGTWAMLTPVGGLCFLAGWGFVVFSAFSAAG